MEQKHYLKEKNKHSVQICDDLYVELKEYCELNNFKIIWFVNKLIREGLNIEKYGDTPFTNYKPKITIEDDEKVNIDTNHTAVQGNITIPSKEEQSVVEEFITKINEGTIENDKKMGDIIENIGGSDKFNEIIDELIYNEEPSKKTEEVIEQPKPIKKKRKLN